MVRCGGMFTNCLRRMMCTSKKVPDPPAAAPQPAQPVIPLQTQPQKKPEIVITMDPKRIATYEDILKIIEQPSKYLIDVRNPDELKETGRIPSSINIPLGVVGEVLSTMSNEDFTKEYQRPKPTTSDELIFTCQSGRRATTALETALKLGYINSKNYTGSWKDWASRQQNN